jgi:hypothetical protein
MSKTIKDPEILANQIKGSFKIRRHELSAWTEVLYDPNDRPPRGSSYDGELDAAFEDDVQVEELVDIQNFGVDSLISNDTRVINNLSEVLFRVEPARNQLIFAPREKTGGRRLHDRYNRVRAIVLDGFTFGRPRTPAEVIHMLARFPEGFTQNPDNGLGLSSTIKFIILAIEHNPEIDLFMLSKVRPTEMSGRIYRLNYQDYETVRRAINKNHRTALAGAAKEEAILAHNALMTKLDPHNYPERTLPASEKTVFKILEMSANEDLSEKDQIAAVKVVHRNTRKLASSNPEALLKLRRDIELVNLEEVIRKMEALIETKTPEARWQKFFCDHPFVLSLAFSLPIVLFQEQVSVGGSTFEGTGEKIADFLVKNDITDNAALIEIKAASTPLLGGPYRGVCPPSHHLSGAITQVLDQKHKLEEEFQTKRYRSKNGKIERYAVRCIVIAGTTPGGRDDVKSFELFRGTLHDVLVVTFDELLEKLRHLRNFLSKADN